jgi:hypothetical protein
MPATSRGQKETAISLPPPLLRNANCVVDCSFI